jgi:C4-type Zn-finger protein
MAHIQSTKECPLCGELMHRKDVELADVIPGTSEVKRRMVSEWICPECDYFEEVEEEERRG